MAKFQFEKKQVLPAIGMGVASAGLFVYFVWKMTSPPPLQAAAEPIKVPTQVASAQAGSTSPNATAGAAGTPSEPLASIDPGIGAPTDSMRDPFAPEIIEPVNVPGRQAPVQEASNNLGPKDLTKGPAGLPPMGPVPPMGLPGGGLPNSGLPGAASAEPQWTVTGVISESSEPHNRIAIFRSGDARRFVRLGDMVDGTYRLIDVNRTGVVVADGSHHIRIPLGGDKKTTAHTPVANGAATGPWTGMPSGPAGAAQPSADQSSPANLQPTGSAPAPGQAPIPGQPAPAQTPAAVPGPAQAAPMAGL